MRIYFEIAADTDKERLLGAVKELATAVEISGVGFDPWGERTFATSLLNSGFPAEKLTEERGSHRAANLAVLNAEWPKVRKLS